MNRRELKKQMQARRGAVKKEIAVRRAELRRQNAQSPSAKRRKRRRVILFIILLLLLLLRECSCSPGEAVVQNPKVTEPVAQKKPLPQRKAKPIRAKIPKVSRPNYRPPSLSPKAWLSEFQIQVAARSRRLASCFEGVARPGAIRWSAAIDPKPGVVSDHSFTPVLASAELSASQRKCLESVLEKPVYRLTINEESAVPERVAMVLEF